MESIDHTVLNRKIEAFKRGIIAIPIYGERIQQDCWIEFEGTHYEIPVFGFRAGCTVRPEIRQICEEMFLHYFPDGKLVSIRGDLV